LEVRFMTAQKRRRPTIRILSLVAAFLGALVVQAPPAFAFQEKKLPANWPFDGDELVRTVGTNPPLVHTFTLSQGQSKNLEAFVMIDVPLGFDRNIQVGGMIGCYRGSQFFPGSFAGLNWLRATGSAISFSIDHVFTAPLTGTYTYSCRLAVEADALAGVPKMVALAGTWIRMSDGNYGNGRTWGLPDEPYVGPAHSSTEPKERYLLRPNPKYAAKPPANGRWASFAVDLYVTACYEGDGALDKVCEGHGGGAGDTIVDTRVVATRLNSVGTSCGQVVYYPPLSSPAQRSVIKHDWHHFTISHPKDTNQRINIGNGITAGCTNNFDIVVKLTHIDGNPVKAHSYTTQRNAGTLVRVNYLFSVANALSEP
jgi:hypothetical protein